MSMIFDKPQIRIQEPDEGTEPVVPSGVDGTGSLNAGVRKKAADPEPLRRQGFHASPLDIEAALLAVDHATTEEELVAAVANFLAAAETAFRPGGDPIATLATVFGAECVATVTEVCATAVIDLEVEAAATGGTITERAASRIARNMVHRATTRAGRTMPRAPRPRGAHRVRIQRGPRTRRAHRRAVRLSAVASAGDGPPPEEPPPATHAPDGEHLSLARVWITSALSIEVGHVDDMVELAVEAEP